MTAIVDIAWPASIPLPYCDYDGSPVNATISSPLNGAHIDRRSRFTKTYVALGLSWVLDDDQFDAFREFVDEDLSNGTSKFAIDLRYPLNSALTNWIIQFVGGYQANKDDGHWQVKADVVLIVKSELSAIAYPSGYQPYYVEETDSNGGHQPYQTSDGFIYWVKNA